MYLEKSIHHDTDWQTFLLNNLSSKILVAQQTILPCRCFLYPYQPLFSYMDLITGTFGKLHDNGKCFMHDISDDSNPSKEQIENREV